MAKALKSTLGDTSGAVLRRIAAALERLAPGAVAAKPPASGDAFVWEPAQGGLLAVETVAAVPLPLLKGIDASRDTLLENTRRFAAGLPANNALLWGARGMGKSSLVKAVHAAVNGAPARSAPVRLKLIEIHREDIESLPELMTLTRATPHRCILFCDDLSFDAEDT